MIKQMTKTVTRLPQSRPPVHPGEMLLEEYMKPYKMTQQQMADHLKISRKHLVDIIHTHKPVTLETAQRLAKLFRTSIEFWIQGQMAYDLWHAVRKPSRTLKAIKPLRLKKCS